MAVWTIGHANCPMAQEGPTSDVAHSLVWMRWTREGGADRNGEGGSKGMQNPEPRRMANWSGIQGIHVIPDGNDSGK